MPTNGLESHAHAVAGRYRAPLMSLVEAFTQLDGGNFDLCI